MMLLLIFYIAEVLNNNNNGDLQSRCCNKDKKTLPVKQVSHNSDFELTEGRLNQFKPNAEEQLVESFKGLIDTVIAIQTQPNDTIAFANTVNHLLHLFCTNLITKLGKEMNENNYYNTNRKQVCRFKINLNCLFEIGTMACSIKQNILQYLKWSYIGYIMNVVTTFEGTFTVGKDDIEISGCHDLFHKTQKILQIITNWLVDSSHEYMIDQGYANTYDHRLYNGTNQRNFILPHKQGCPSVIKQQKSSLILIDSSKDEYAARQRCIEEQSIIIFAFDPQEKIVYICAGKVILVINTKKYEESRIQLIKESSRNIFNPADSTCNEDSMKIIDDLLRIPLVKPQSEKKNAELCCGIDSQSTTDNELSENLVAETENLQYDSDIDMCNTTLTGIEDDKTYYERLFSEMPALKNDDDVLKDGNISEASNASTMSDNDLNNNFWESDSAKDKFLKSHETQYDKLTFEVSVSDE
ncbi:hypothetical protein THOM_1920 [Trachipleistophora hominis]|uniref:Uncharacterized protein n=1 Tax=Trachipleistophora hominis TaxID=72359 RepID=L7JV00_TRAHO|nr:hypothetical protein THOM_1920 [Trachipleistophora hominis]